MEEQELTPEQQAEVAAVVAEFEQQLARVGVDVDEASAQLRELASPVRRPISDDEYEVVHTVDVSAILETLRALPDGAGTAAFVASYSARLRDAAPPAG